jgi:hypothetical protein
MDAVNGDAKYREQYSDAVGALIGDQARAGLDVVTDGEMRFDVDVGGRSWFGYAVDRMDGLKLRERGVVAMLKTCFCATAASAQRSLLSNYDSTRVTEKAASMKQPIDPLISYLKMSQDVANLLSNLETKIEHLSNNPELNRNLSNRLQGIARQMKPKERDLQTSEGHEHPFQY